MKLLKISLVVAGLLMFTACSDDDDSSSSSSSTSTETTTTVDTLSSMPTNASVAGITTTNANDLVNADKVSKSAKTASLEESENSSKFSAKRKSILSKLNNIYIYPAENETKATVTDVAVTLECDTSGTMEGTYNLDTSTYVYTMSLTSNDCVEDGYKENGEVTFVVDYIDSSLVEYSEFTLTIGSSGYTFESTDGTYSGSMAANSYMKEYDITSFDTTAEEPTVYKESNYAKATVSDESYYEDSIKQWTSTTKYYFVSGNFYISDSEYFSVDSSYDASATPFEVDSDYNIIDGTAQFVGESDGKIQIDVTSSDTATIRLDSNNDGVWETEETGVDISEFGL